MEYTNTIGRRKTSVARVYLSAGKGEVIVNGKELKDYFSSEILQNVVNQPFAIIQAIGMYDVRVTVDGGGPTGQAEAIRMAISRALCKVNLELRSPLKKEGLLRRDPRMVERKKYGRRKARRRFQFSKR